MAGYTDGSMANWYDLPIEEKIISLRQERAKMIAKINFYKSELRNIEKHIEMLEGDNGAK